MGGTLDIVIKKSPVGEWDPRVGDRHTDVSIGTVEWEHLFLRSLGAPTWERFTEEEEIDVYYSRQRERFQTAVESKGYPLLSRIWRIYRDTEYLPSEVSALSQECMTLLDAIEDPYSRSALEKLLAASKEALTIQGGISLLSD